MKLIPILLTVFCVQVSAVAVSQQITLKTKNEPIANVFRDIRKQSGYLFLFDDEVLAQAKPVSIDVQKAALGDVLRLCFTGQPLTYSLIDKTIVVQPLQVTPAAQTRGELKGKVRDAMGEPLPGASITIEGTSIGTKSDAEGNYRLELDEGVYTVVVSYVGYEKVNYPHVEVTTAGRTLNVTMQGGTQLEEVEVSYGKQRQREITGAITQVDASALQDMPVMQFSQQLQGKVAGVQISQVSGQPGRGMAFRIRGAASLSAGNQPLFVIDGTPITGSINNINPAEIETFTVLKDASATSLYGSRAANGVILITTKHAKPGDAKINFTSNYGVQSIPMDKVPKMMNAREFAEFYNELYADKAKYENVTTPVPEVYANPERYGEGTNWFDVLTRQAPIQRYDLMISSARDKSASAVMAGYQEQEGVLVNTGTKLFSLRLNHDLSLGSRDQLQIGFNLAPSYRIDHNNRLGTDGLAGLFQWAVESSPLVPAVNPDGTYPLNVNTAGMVYNINPYAQMMLTKDDYKTTRILGNAYLNYAFVEGLTLKTNLAVDKGAETRNRFSPSSVSSTSMATGTSSAADNYSWTAEANLVYNKSINDHHIEALVGYSGQKYQGESNNVEGQAFPSDDVEWLSAATEITAGTSNYTDYSLLSAIGRLNYNYKGKYLFSAAMRRDGSSRFGADRKYGSFPSMSVGWIVSDEPFMEGFKQKIDLLKLRASYGITGNNEIGNYTHISTLGSYNYIVDGSLTPGYTVNSLGNSELAWERNKQFDIGFDLSLWNSRITFSYDYYHKLSDGMIQVRPIPRSSGFVNIQYNTGAFEFWGHELNLNTVNLTGNLKWNSSFNISFDRNLIKSLVEPGYIVANTAITGDYFHNQVGHRLGEFYGFVNLGLYQDENDLNQSAQYHVGNYHSDVGTIKMKDISGPDGVPDGVIDDVHDRTFIGDPTPDFLFGFTNNFAYKRFDLSISMAGSVGGQVLNVVKWTHLANMDGARNLLADIKDRWRSPENPGSGMYPRTATNTTILGRYPNSQWVENGSYLTIKNIALGYTVPLKQDLLLKNLRIYAAVQQALVWSAYSGMNPEINANGLDATKGIGVDGNAYPIPRTFSIGLSTTFK
ncbi:TonB-dependent receptor [Olivibacter ginsenosidimutans]|uniref:TonB-dependent receptor n=1 Tax=Olivibacter ginsenosidimutans TaxID=1176537 RepID=A0ABP9AGT2_9SPHI